MTPDTSGWSRAEIHVLSELDRLSKKMDAVDEKVTNLRVEVAHKGAIWGAVSGAVVGLGAFLFRKVAP